MAVRARVFNFPEDSSACIMTAFLKMKNNSLTFVQWFLLKAPIPRPYPLEIQI